MFSELLIRAKTEIWGQIVAQSEKSNAACREIIDMTGRKVMVPEVVKSVFAASFYGYTMLASLAPEMIVATPFPPRPCDKAYLHPHLHDLPLIEKITETEAIARVKPDVVVVWADKERPYHKKSEEALNSLGIPFVYVIIGNLGDVPDFPAAYEFLGDLLGVKDRAKMLADYCRKTLAEVATVVAAVPVEKKPAVYYAEGDDGLLTEFDDSLHAHLLKLLGDVNVHRGHMTEHKGLEEISFAQVAAYDPEIIIAWKRAFVEMALNDDSWGKIRAVHNRRVYAIPDSPFNWFDRPPCFMRIIGLKWLAGCLYPQACQIDMIKETQEFYSLFLGIDISETTATKVLAQQNF